MNQATAKMTTDPEVYMRQVAKDVKNATFHLDETHRYMSFNSCMRLLAHIGHYNDHCETYDAERFEDYAERIDCVLASVEPKWRGYAIVFILNECIEKAKVDDTFDDSVENHILFWKNHLFRQPYIGTITRYSHYTDLLLHAIRVENRDEDDSNHKAVEERYVTYMWRAFYAFRANELTEAKERLAPHKEGIIMAAWHPDRLNRLLQQGYTLDDITA